jgi:hypothetical protein
MQVTIGALVTLTQSTAWVLGSGLCEPQEASGIWGLWGGQVLL